jgi:hypothetical protein
VVAVGISFIVLLVLAGLGLMRRKKA